MYILPPRCKTKQKNLIGLSGLDVSHYTVDAEEIVFTSLKKMLTFQIWEECSSPFLLPTSRELKPKKKYCMKNSICWKHATNIYCLCETHQTQ